MAQSLIPIGDFDAASDKTMAFLVRLPESESQEAIVELISPVAADIIANDPTLIAAAVDAVDAAIASWDIEANKAQMRVLLQDRTAFKVDALGTHVFGPLLAAGARVEQGFDDRLRVLSADGRLLWSSRQSGGGSTGTTFKRVVCLLVMGQSNAEGRGLPLLPRLDVPHPNIFMTTWDGGVGGTVSGLSPATVPLASQQQQVGLSLASTIARDIVAEQPDTAVVIVNAAVGGTPLVTTNSIGSWDPDYAGTGTALLNVALDAWQETQGLIQAAFGVPAETWMVWHQGEGDAAATRAQYAAKLDQLISVSRTRIGDPTAPFVLGGMVPEDMTAGERAGVGAAHWDTPARVLYTGYADGIPNGGGSQAVDDRVHYYRESAERLGHHMWDGLKRAMGNAPGTVAHPPMDVSARVVAGTLTASWSHPLTRVTAFTVQYRVDGGTWTPITGRAVPGETRASVSGIPSGVVEVRISSTNENGTSAFSTPITAIGA